MTFAYFSMKKSRASAASRTDFVPYKIFAPPSGDYKFSPRGERCSPSLAKGPAPPKAR